MAKFNISFDFFCYIQIYVHGDKVNGSNEGNASRKAQLVIGMESRPGHSMSCQLAWLVPMQGVGAKAGLMPRPPSKPAKMQIEINI